MPTQARATLIAFVACVTSRLLSAIYYIEDPDSLRFALSTVEYDVPRLQPHFPGYPVFCWLVKLFDATTGSYAVAFALVGGISTWLIILSLVAIADQKLNRPEGVLIAGLVFLNPLFWIMGNRYMPDLTGLACLLGAFHFLTLGRRLTLGGFLIGLLAGIRLSYLPFAIAPMVHALWVHSTGRLRLLAGGLAGVVIWLLPLVWMTGLHNLIDAARTQSAGHFSDFGGTVWTEPDLLIRLGKLSEGILADGMGLYWTDRHWSTAVTALALLTVIVPVLAQTVRRRSQDKLFRIHLLCWALYLVWIFLGQNIIYKSRHVIPLLPLVILIVAQAALVVRRSARTFWHVPLAVFLVGHAYVTTHLVIQHRRPSAIAQIKTYLEAKSGPDLHIVTVPLIEYYLSTQGVRGTYITIEAGSDLVDMSPIPDSATVVTIGSPHDFPDRPLKSRRGFYHNPYVNRMWSEIDVYEY